MEATEAGLTETASGMILDSVISFAVDCSKYFPVAEKDDAAEIVLLLLKSVEPGAMALFQLTIAVLTEGRPPTAGGVPEKVFPVSVETVWSARTFPAGGCFSRRGTFPSVTQLRASQADSVVRETPPAPIAIQLGSVNRFTPLDEKSDSVIVANPT